MIPDYPAEKKKLMLFWNKYFTAKHLEYLGFFGQLPTFTNHEGNQWMLYRTDGTSEITPYHDVTGQLLLSIDEAPFLTPEKLAKKIDKVAEEMARQTAQSMFAEISRVTDQVGNTINARGQPLSKELFLQLIDKIDMDFDKEGKLIPPALVVSPSFWETKKDEIQSWGNDPDFQAKHEEIINKKRVEWNARENRRKLVD